MAWDRYTLLALVQPAETTCFTTELFFLQQKLFVRGSSMVCFLHLVCALLSALLVNKGEGLPAYFGALTRRALTSLKDPPLRREPPVEDGLKLRPLDGAQKDHGFFKVFYGRQIYK